MTGKGLRRAHGARIMNSCSALAEHIPPKPPPLVDPSAQSLRDCAFFCLRGWRATVAGLLRNCCVATIISELRRNCEGRTSGIVPLREKQAVFLLPARHRFQNLSNWGAPALNRGVLLYLPGRNASWRGNPGSASMANLAWAWVNRQFFWQQAGQRGFMDNGNSFNPLLDHRQGSPGAAVIDSCLRFLRGACRQHPAFLF